MADALEAMHALFSPIVKGLNAADYVQVEAEDIPSSPPPLSGEQSYSP
jgi:hypothetical protein